MQEVGASAVAAPIDGVKGSTFSTGYTWSNHRLVRVNAGRALWEAGMADGWAVRLSWFHRFWYVAKVPSPQP